MRQLMSRRLAPRARAQRALFGACRIRDSFIARGFQLMPSYGVFLVLPF